MESGEKEITRAMEGGTKRSIALTDQTTGEVRNAEGDLVLGTAQLVTAVRPPVVYGPSHSQGSGQLMLETGMPRETSRDEPLTPKHKTRRSDSSPPMLERYGPIDRVGK